MHVCHTADGVDITLGLRVRDYDNRVGVVVGAPPAWDLDDATCWPSLGHNGHWWAVCPDRVGHVHGTTECRGGSFDGSRMTTRGV